MLKDAGILKTSEAYRFDIMDLQRQIMTNLGQAIHKEAAKAFEEEMKRDLNYTAGDFWNC